MATPPTTDNHDLPLIPPVGESNAEDYANQWGSILNDSGWSQIEELLIVRDTESNRTNYTAYDGALFWATDSGAVYTGDGSSWSKSDASFAELALSSLAISGSITTDSGTTIWDGTNDYVPANSLEHDTVTVGGNSVSLGGSTSISHSDLAGISGNDHHEVFEPSDYNPEADTHDRYADSEAISAVEGSDLSMGSNQLSFQPASDGGSVTAISFDSNTNTGSDQASIRYHDDYFGDGSGEQSALRLVTENDSGGSFGPDAIVLDGIGGTYVERGDLNVSNGIFENDNRVATRTWVNSSNPSIPNAGLSNDSLTVAGNTVSLGASTTVAHADLSSVSNDDHHTYPVPNSGIANSSVTVAGNSVSLGGTTSVAHADLSSVSNNDHHTYPVPNSGISNSSVTVAGNSVSLGGSTSVAHSDLSGIGANDHHTAHEHPGDQSASSALDMSSNGITNVTTITGQYAEHDFGGSSYNIDLLDSNADARYRNTSNNTIIWFRENRDVDIPGGNLSVGGSNLQLGSDTGIIANNDNFYIDMEATAGAKARIYDQQNKQNVFIANEGGNIEIPSGNLTVSDAAGSSFVAESGDSMSGKLTVGDGSFSTPLKIQAPSSNDGGASFLLTGGRPSFSMTNDSYGHFVELNENGLTKFQKRSGSGGFDYDWLVFDHADDSVDFKNVSLQEQGNRVATRSWTNNNADVPNADYADVSGEVNTANFEVVENSSTNSLEFNYVG